MSFVVKLGDSIILKRLRINPGNWRWNTLANYSKGLITDQVLTEFDGFENFHANATDEKKYVMTNFIL